MTDTETIEVDWFRKYHEGIGQALHYSMVTGRAPGLALIVKPSDWPMDAGDRSKLTMIRELTAKHGIRLYLLHHASACPGTAAAQTAMRQ